MIFPKDRGENKQQIESTTGKKHSPWIILILYIYIDVYTLVTGQIVSHPSDPKLDSIGTLRFCHASWISTDDSSD